MTFFPPVGAFYHPSSGGGGGSGLTPHRYWGVRLLSNQYGPGVSEVGLANIEMAETAFGPNVLPPNGTAYATAAESGYPASSALIDSDGGIHAYYYAFLVDVPIWYYDFGSGNDIAINRVTILGFTNTTHYNVKDMDVVYSDDGTTWTIAWSETNIPLTVLYDMHHSFAPGAIGSYSGSPWGSHKYWRMFAVEGNLLSLGELILEASSGSGQQAVGGTASAINSNLGAAANAFDGVATTYWGTSVGYSAWLQYYLAAGFSVGAFTLKAVDDTSGSYYIYTPNTFRFRFSDDGTTFTTILKPVDQSAFSNAESRTFVDPYFI